MFPIRVKTVQESDLRMLGNLARNIQRVLPVTQADIDAAAALGKGWVVWKVFEVSDPLDNLRGGTQLIIRQNSIQPGQNVRRVIFVAGPGGQTVVIRGTDYIVLPDAIANSLQYVKAFGGTEQNGTPTPDTPVDIVSNNGVLKVRHQSGLPLGYRLVDYIKANARIELDALTNNTMEFVARLYREGLNPQYLYQADTTSGGTTNTTAYVSSGGNWRFGSRTAAIDLGTGVMITSVQNADGVWINGEQVGTYEGVTAFTSTNNLRLFGATQATPQLRLYGLKVYQNGAPFYDLVPCQRESDSAYGVYDLVSGQFFTNADATITAGSFVSDPVEIYTDGTVETINVHGKNLFKSADWGTWYPSTSGTIASAGTNRTVVIRCLPNTKYYFKHCTYRGGLRAFYTEEENWDIGSPCSYTGVVAGDANVVYSITTSTNAKWLFVCFGRIDSSTTATYAQQASDYMLSIEELTSATEYEPYYDGGTATAEILLKVGDYQDVQSIIDGAVTRSIGIKIFDGTETFISGQNGWITEAVQDQYWENTNPYVPICSHFVGTSDTPTSDSNTVRVYRTSSNTGRIYFGVDKSIYTSTTVFKQWLADQYAAGTPVIVIYPLATPTTESVAGQTLQVTAGDNVLEITQASLTGLELEAQYSAAVTLTVQEVEDANLDNNVTVTIS